MRVLATHECNGSPFTHTSEHEIARVHTLTKETFNHTCGFTTKPVGVEVEHDPSVLLDQFNCFAVVLQSISSAFEDASYR